MGNGLDRPNEERHLDRKHIIRERSHSFGSTLGSDRVDMDDSTNARQHSRPQNFITWNARQTNGVRSNFPSNVNNSGDSSDGSNSQSNYDITNELSGAGNFAGFADSGWSRSIEGVHELRASQPTDSRFISSNNSVVTAQVSSTAVLHCRTSSATGGLVSIVILHKIKLLYVSRYTLIT